MCAVTKTNGIELSRFEWSSEGMDQSRCETDWIGEESI